MTDRGNLDRKAEKASNTGSKSNRLSHDSPLETSGWSPTVPTGRLQSLILKRNFSSLGVDELQKERFPTTVSRISGSGRGINIPNTLQRRNSSAVNKQAEPAK